MILVNTGNYDVVRKKKHTITLFALVCWMIIPNILTFINISNVFVLQGTFLLLPVAYFLRFKLRLIKMSGSNILLFFLLFIPIILSLVFNLTDIITFINIINFFLLYFMVSAFVEIDFDLLKKALIIVIFFNIALIIYMLLLTGFGSRITATGVQPNFIGLTAVTIVLSSLLIGKKPIIILMVIFSFAVCVSVSTRAAMVCILISMFIYGTVIFKKMSNRYRLAVGIVVLLILLASLQEIYQLLFEALQVDSSSRGLDSGLSGRTARWTTALLLWSQNALFGIGFKRGDVVLGFSTDNAYISVLLELGIVGFSAYLIFCLSIVIISLKVLVGKEVNTNLYFAAIVSLTYFFYGLFERRYINFGNQLTYIFFIALISLFSKKSSSVNSHYQ